MNPLLNTMGVDTKAELIQALVSIGLGRVKEVFEQEVKLSVGERYKRERISG